jgi:hypothetical protein
MCLVMCVYICVGIDTVSVWVAVGSGGVEYVCMVWWWGRFLAKKSSGMRYDVVGCTRVQYSSI